MNSLNRIKMVMEHKLPDRVPLGELWIDPKTVNAVAPGPVDTELISPEIKERLRSLSLTGEIAKPDEIAHAVIFLLENDHITGEVIDVNGGRLMD